MFQSVDRVPSPCQLDWSAEPLHLLHSPVRQQYQVHIETPATLCHTLSLSLSVVRHIWRSTTTSPTRPSLMSLLRYMDQLSQVSQCVQTPQLNCSYLCPLSLSDRYVLLGNHHDAWTFGAVDPNSGTAVLMELARALSDLRSKSQSPSTGSHTLPSLPPSL